MLLFVFSLRFRASTYTINIIMYAYIYKEREKPYLKLRVPALCRLSSRLLLFSYYGHLPCLASARAEKREKVRENLELSNFC